MAYSKTAWTEEIALTAARLNNMETQYEEAETALEGHWKDTSKMVIAEVVNSLPAAGTAGRLVFNSTDKKLYFDDGVRFNEQEFNSANDYLGEGAGTFQAGQTRTLTVSMTDGGILFGSWGWNSPHADLVATLKIDGTTIEQVGPGMASTGLLVGEKVVASGNRTVVVELTGANSVGQHYISANGVWLVDA